MLTRRSAYLVSLALAAVLILPWGVVQPRALDDVRNFVFDSFQRISPRVYDPEAPTRVVGVDEASLKAYGQWPWPRTRLAELVDRLRELGAASIAFDFIFAEPDRASPSLLAENIIDARLREQVTRLVAKSPDGDTVFAHAIATAPVTLGATINDVGGAAPLSKSGFVMAGDDPAPFVPEYVAMVTPLPKLIEAARGLGATNWLPDRDQIVRRTPLLLRVGEVIFPSLALEAMRVAQGEQSVVIRSSNASGQTAFGKGTGINAIKVGAFEVDTGAYGEVRPRYSHRAAARDVSAKDVLERRVARSEIEGRIIFVGALAAALGDVRATPLDPVVPGVEIHAQIVESLTSGALLARPDWAPGFEFVVAIAAFMATMTILYFGSPVLSAAGAAIIIAALFGGAFVAFQKYALLLDPAFPSLAVIGGYFVGAVTLWRAETAARRHVRRAFGKFVAPAVVEKLAENPDLLVLGGETRELTVLQSDLRDFSGLSEGLDARELTQFMNDYLTPMTDAILECEGTVDKYMGDAILAFWNAPLDVTDHPRKALDAALMMRSALERLNDKRARDAALAEREFKPIRVGLGLHLGPCSVGNMGSIRRFDYSILGDTVNVAARLEGASKSFGVDIVCSGALQAAAPDFAWLDLGDLVLLGKTEKTRAFTLAGGVEAAVSDAYVRWRTDHDAMLGDYELGRFDQAAARAAVLVSNCDPAWSALYVRLGKRYSDLARQDLQAGWAPVWNLTTK